MSHPTLRSIVRRQEKRRERQEAKREVEHELTPIQGGEETKEIQLVLEFPAVVERSSTEESYE